MRTVVFVLTLLVSITPVASAATSVVVIRGWALQPARITTLVGQPLMFLNRSGADVDIRFVGSAERHRIAQTNGSMLAVVRDPGRHPFVVRFRDDRRHLHGVVEAHDARSALGGLPICGKVPPSELCIEK